MVSVSVLQMYFHGIGNDMLNEWHKGAILYLIHNFPNKCSICQCSIFKIIKDWFFPSIILHNSPKDPIQYQN